MTVSNNYSFTKFEREYTRENRANIFNLQRVILYSYTVRLGRNRPSFYSIDQLYLRHKLFVNFQIERNRDNRRTKTSVTVLDLTKKKKKITEENLVKEHNYAISYFKIKSYA